MLHHLPRILTAEQVLAIRTQLEAMDWGDGGATAGHQSTRVKANLQLGSDAPGVRALGIPILHALEASPLFLSAALPRHVFPPLFNRHDAGMAFGMHVDNAVRQVPGTASRLRTDLSATLFLSDPGAYDGGELVIADNYGEHALRPAAGDLILYPARSLHRVEPVTRGSRIASVFWIQSMVRGGDARDMLFDLDTSIQALTATVGDDPALVRLTGLYHNLLREWAEL